MTGIEKRDLNSIFVGVVERASEKAGFNLTEEQKQFVLKRVELASKHKTEDPSKIAQLQILLMKEEIVTNI